LITGRELRDLDFTWKAIPPRWPRELEKGGAKVLAEDEKFRPRPILPFAGDVEGSISARDEHYVRPRHTPELRWSPSWKILRRPRFFPECDCHFAETPLCGIAAHPTNGLSETSNTGGPRTFDSQLTIQPVRLLRALRLAAGWVSVESRTQGGFNSPSSANAADHNSEDSRRRGARLSARSART